MEKKIYWIDDYPGAILTIAENIFPYFWKLDEDEGIETHVKLIGNAFQEPPGLELWSKKDEQNLQEALMEQFKQVWKDKKRFEEDKVIEHRKKLIYGNVKFLYKNPENDVEKEQIKEYRKLCELWQSNLKDNETRNEAKKLAQKLYQLLDIDLGACVALDMALLQGDIEKIQKKAGPILSMELYHLIKKSHKCFLYSYYVFDNSFINAWKDFYKYSYEDSEEPVIYSRSAMYTKKLTGKLIEELLIMINKSYEKEV